MRERILLGRIRHDTDRDASIHFGLTFSLLRVEQHADKKIVPLELHIRWFFWTWQQNIFVLL